MSEEQELLRRFDKVLRTVKNKRNLLYNCIDGSDIYSKEIPMCKPSDVIIKVTEQLKAIHRADITKRNFDKVRKDDKTFKVAVNTSREAQVHQLKQINKLETQFELDTQMLDVIENAEASVENKGFTQEFNNTFCNENLDKSNRIIESPHFSHPKSPILVNKSVKADSTGSVENLKQNNNTLENVTQTDEECKSNRENFKVYEQQCEIETISNIDIIDDNEELPCSYIFEPLRKSNTPSPLVFDLDTFESFEKIAQPIVCEHFDNNLAKHIINSQIIGKELFLLCDDTFQSFNDRQLSPVLEVEKNRLKIVRNEEEYKDIHFNKTNQSLVQGSKKCSFLNDEILFSSDEECENFNTDLPDMPLTCALETSFYEQEAVLDKTMYVGFQTASDKSIKVCRDSFNKAKSLLDDDEKVDTNTTLSKLVQMCDKKSSESSKYCKNINTQYSETEVKSQEEEEMLSSKNEMEHFEPIWLDVSTKPKLKNVDIADVDDEEVTNLEYRSPVSCPEKRKHNESIHTMNKKFKASDESIAKCNNSANDLSEQLDDDIINDFQQDMASFEDKKEIIEKFIGFKTASHKNIFISEAAFDRVNKIFEDIEISQGHKKNCFNKTNNKINRFVELNESLNDPIGTFSNVLIECNTYDTLKTNQASKCQNDSETHSECNGRTLFKNNQKLKHDIESKCFESNSFIGFRTASNKHIDISEKAYLKTKNMFNNIAIDDLVEDDITLDVVDGVKREERYKNIQSKDLVSSTAMFNDVSFDLNKHTSIPFNCSSKNLDMKIVQKEVRKDFECYKALDAESTEIEQKRLLKSANACNKDRTISTEAICRSKILLRELSENDKPTVKKSKNSTNSVVSQEGFTKSNLLSYESKSYVPQKLSLPYVGFQTASNRPIKISLQALSKCQDIFKDIAKESDCFQNDKIDSGNLSNFKNDQSSNEEPTFGYIASDSDNLIKVSKESLGVSKLLMNNEITIDKYKLSHDDDIHNSQSYIGKTECFKGFQTASKKTVKISARALATSKALFKDIDKEFFDPQNTHKTSDYTNNTKCDAITNKKGFAIAAADYKVNPPISFKSDLSKCFHTASNKPITISTQALSKSKELFKKFDDKSDCHQNHHNRFNKTNKDSISVASQQLIKGLDESFNKSKLLLTKELINETLDKQCNFKFEGFQTASNKTIGVSEEMLAASKKVFKDIDDFNGVCSKSKDYKKSTAFIGFKTASKKAIQISEVALEKSRQLFKDINSNEHIKIDNQSGPKNSENDSKFRNAESQNHLNISQSVKENGIENFLDTPAITNFENTLHTEDFCAIIPNKSKRSGSPILSCPKPKKRKKFQTPYNSKNDLKSKLKTIENVAEIDEENHMLFSEQYKEAKTYTLLNLADIEKSYTKTSLPDTYITQFCYDTLLEFKFTGKRNDITECSINIEDIKKLFIDAVKKKLLPEGWLDNHLKLIIWKLISYEIIFPNTLKGVCSVRNVLDQLRYRYNKELYNAERPILRKILEKDDVPSKTLILCVVAIFENGQSVNSVSNVASNMELLLSDGWYVVKASVDRMLTKYVIDGKIKIGGKLATSGAELVNCEQGVSPWEDTSAVRLKIFGNSTRRARWYARLGCHRNGVVCTPLSSIKPDGGKVSKLRVYVTRVYPALFVEKFENGSTVTRSERLEHIHQAKYEIERQTALEKLYEEVEKELSDQDSQDSESSIPNRRFPDSLSQRNVESHITHSQARYLEARSNKRREKMIQNIEKRVQEKMGKYGLDTKRNVIPLLKLRVAGVELKSGAVVVTKGLLSIWKPALAVMEMLKEGSWIEVLNVFPTAVRYSEIQISAGRSSVFMESKTKENDLVEKTTRCLNRKCYHIKDLVKNPTAPSDYNEIDTVGLIIQIEPQNADFETSKQPFQNVYLVDAEKNMICINFWGGLKKFGFTNILDTGQLVACVNLQRRTGNTKKSVPHYRVTEFSYFTKTPKSVAARNIVEELVKQLSGLDKRKYCYECVALKNSLGKKQNHSNENYSPYRFQDQSISKYKMFIDSPQPQQIVDSNLNLTGLDFESTFKLDTELSPQLLLRKKKVNEKIAKLKCYGEPPPLSPINIINLSKNATNSFKSPFASKDAVTRKACESSKKENDTPISPIMCLNRTYVKSVNPVKLNFSNIHDTSIDGDIDHFAEEFDASPPLSLD